MNIDRTSRAYGLLLSSALILTMAAVYFWLRSGAMEDSNATLIDRDQMKTGIALILAAFVAAILAIRSVEPPDRLKRVWETLFVVPLVGFISLVVLLPVAGSYRGPRRNQCLSNIKRLSMALLLYREENDGGIPVGNVWRTTTMEYLDRKEDIECPWAESEFSYGMNDEVAGKSDLHLKDQQTLVMLFECASEIPNFVGGRGQFLPRHNGLGTIGFADGHAKFLKAENRDVRWKL